MATFTDRKGGTWSIQLDAPTVDEIRQDYSVNLVALDNDPIGPLRNDPMMLVTVVSILCRDAIAEKGLSPTEFARLLPSPPDSMLDAVRDAVVCFFPSGRASHIREVLSKFDLMAGKTDELASEKMQQVMDDPKLMRQLSDRADLVISKAIEKMAHDHGT